MITCSSLVALAEFRNALNAPTSVVGLFIVFAHALILNLRRPVLEAGRLRHLAPPFDVQPEGAEKNELAAEEEA